MITWTRGKSGCNDLCTLVVGRPQFPNYTYIVANPSTSSALVIDPGYEAETIRAELKRNDLVLSGILLTHGHSDHLAAAPQLVASGHTPVVLMEGELIDAGYDVPNLITCAHDQPFAIDAVEVHPFATPGHTPGSACYLIDDMLFTGDTVFIEAIGDCSGTRGDVEKMFNSIVMLKRRVPDHVRVFPGHRYRAKPGSSFGTVRLENVYFRFDRLSSFENWYRRMSPTPEKSGCNP